MITQAELRAALRYDAATGDFFWIKAARGRRAGSRAGSVNSEGYIKVGLQGRIYGAHQLAWLYVSGKWPDKKIDHIDRRRDNNAMSNLRLANNQQNAVNRSATRGKKTPKGVYKHPGTSKWRAAIKVNGKSRTIGFFATQEEAATAYAAASEAEHGNFASINP